MTFYENSRLTDLKNRKNNTLKPFVKLNSFLILWKKSFIANDTVFVSGP